MIHLLNPADLNNANKTLDMLYDSWVTSENLDGTDAELRRSVVHDRNTIRTVIGEIKRQMVNDRRKPVKKAKK